MADRHVEPHDEDLSGIGAQFEGAGRGRYNDLLHEGSRRQEYIRKFMEGLREDTLLLPMQRFFTKRRGVESREIGKKMKAEVITTMLQFPCPMNPVLASNTTAAFVPTPKQQQNKYERLVTSANLNT
ncbi:hypothetical protein SNOG_14812 [Parastagonospora nodorum SN15]|uniref:Uncharacterized protein n=1 Tax=Phaeosphaeria nodorum (strain SN15 / ATCC MYA-4574 / FGSC 10173) TaxID=321614 RepID=Q0TZW0_PHANO|nr:hypothetical protein SNOG_14812 [Parastagonospora nodorum SN15]EAT77664.1 hypothetical protein SNOG_14812 [Parastagonospora nodorum SN15]